MRLSTSFPPGNPHASKKLQSALSPHPYSRVRSAKVRFPILPALTLGPPTTCKNYSSALEWMSPKLFPKCGASGPKAGESLRRFLCRFAQDCFKDRHLNRFAEVVIETCLLASR